MKDPWFDNIKPVDPKLAMDAARAHSAQKATLGKSWLPYDDSVMTVVEPPRKLREALNRGR